MSMTTTPEPHRGTGAGASGGGASAGGASWRAARWATAALLASAALFGALTACTAASPTASSGGSTAPASEVGAVWLDGGRVLGVLTQGSSTCAPVAADPTLDAEGVLHVLLAPSMGSACADDLVWRATLIAAPTAIDRADELRVEVTGEAQATVALPGVDVGAAPAEEYAPSAGWSTIDDTLVVLSWGSSSCPAVLASADAAGPGEVELRFAELDATRSCTMDMVPRAVIARTPADAREAQTAVLVSDAFGELRVPIAGAR